VKAGELGGALDVTLKRLAEFMEKAEKLRAKVTAALFYPTAVMLVATAVVGLLLVFVLPRFKAVFAGLGNLSMPAFTELVFGLSDAIKNHSLLIVLAAVAVMALIRVVLSTTAGRLAFDRCKLNLPALGPVVRKAAISRFARTFGTLINSGVPILQALTILRETSGNVVVGNLVASVHQRVKEGESIAPVLKGSTIFPAMIAGMVDVGEQTGALPDMLMKIADNCDEQVDNVMLVFLAVVVGSIVVAMFLPLIHIISEGFDRETPAEN
jgi:type IV pilus assembly protein PilC